MAYKDQLSGNFLVRRMVVWPTSDIPAAAILMRQTTRNRREIVILEKFVIHEKKYWPRQPLTTSENVDLNGVNQQGRIEQAISPGRNPKHAGHIKILNAMRVEECEDCAPLEGAASKARNWAQVKYQARLSVFDEANKARRIELAGLNEPEGKRRRIRKKHRLPGRHQSLWRSFRYRISVMRFNDAQMWTGPAPAHIVTSFVRAVSSSA